MEFRPRRSGRNRPAATISGCPSPSFTHCPPANGGICLKPNHPPGGGSRNAGEIPGFVGSLTLPGRGNPPSGRHRIPGIRNDPGRSMTGMNPCRMAALLAGVPGLTTMTGTGIGFPKIRIVIFLVPIPVALLAGKSRNSATRSSARTCRRGLITAHAQDSPP